MTNAEHAAAAAMTRRTQQGFRLEFRIPDRADTFTKYCVSEADKADTLRRATAKGWTLVSA
jgi:hypothetical protein